MHSCFEEKTSRTPLNKAMPDQRKRRYSEQERGVSGGAPMASPRESRASTKIAVLAPIEQKSRALKR
jgi:hypothetical protein